MNPVEILELSDRDFSVLVPLLEKKKADRILRYVERYLSVIGYKNESSWVESKESDSWFTKFLFRFPEPQSELKKAIKFALTRALKEEV